MKHTSLKEYTAAFDRAAREFLASRGVTAIDDYNLQLESCPIHGPACVRVTYGVLRDHFSVGRSDPSSVAADLLATMLPSAASAAVNDPDVDQGESPGRDAVRARDILSFPAGKVGIGRSRMSSSR